MGVKREWLELEEEEVKRQLVHKDDVFIYSYGRRVKQGV